MANLSCRITYLSARVERPATDSLHPLPISLVEKKSIRRGRSCDQLKHRRSEVCSGNFNLSTEMVAIQTRLQVFMTELGNYSSIMPSFG
jgi:hypothetical protein